MPAAAPEIPHSPFKVACAPYGWFVSIPIVLSFVGMVMVSAGGFSCEMLKVGDYGYTTYSIGFTSIKYGGICVAYDPDDTEPALQAGNAFAIVATVFGVLTVLCATLTTFIRFPPVALLAMSASAFAVAAFAAVVSGVGFGLEGCHAGEAGFSCKPGPMMWVVVVGAVFWIGAAISLPFVKRYERADVFERGSLASSKACGVSAEPVKDDEDPTASASTVIETVLNADGTKTRTTTVTSYKDGTMCVEKTSEAA